MAAYINNLRPRQFQNFEVCRGKKFKIRLRLHFYLELLARLRIITLRLLPK